MGADTLLSITFLVFGKDKLTLEEIGNHLVDSSKFDPSQVEAIMTGLSRELALIQVKKNHFFQFHYAFFDLFVLFDLFQGPPGRGRNIVYICFRAPMNRNIEMFDLF